MLEVQLLAICGITTKGRASTARAKTRNELALKANEKGPVAIADELGISRSSVQRILRKAYSAVSLQKSSFFSEFSDKVDIFPP